jgi:hypothetical protein
MKVILSIPDGGYSEHTWWRLFQNRVMHTKLDIYVFITANPTKIYFYWHCTYIVFIPQCYKVQIKNYKILLKRAETSIVQIAYKSVLQNVDISYCMLYRRLYQGICIHKCTRQLKQKQIFVHLYCTVNVMIAG